jgi:signal peptidase I
MAKRGRKPPRVYTKPTAPAKTKRADRKKDAQESPSTGNSLANKAVDARTRKRQRRARKRREMSRASSLIELAVIILVAIGLALGIQRFLPSGSMEPTLKVGQRFIANRIGMALNGPHVGEIAVFHPPTSTEEQLCGPEPHVVRTGGAPCDAPVAHEETGTNFVKRVVAGPGQWLYIKEGHAYTSKSERGPFVREHDPYIRPCAPLQKPTCNYPVPIQIPPGHWFMMGDNRGESDDSRFWGPVPAKWFIAGAIATYWPPNRIGFF